MDRLDLLDSLIPRLTADLERLDFTDVSVVLESGYLEISVGTENGDCTVWIEDDAIYFIGNCEKIATLSLSDPSTTYDKILESISSRCAQKKQPPSSYKISYMVTRSEQAGL